MFFEATELIFSYLFVYTSGDKWNVQQERSLLKKVFILGKCISITEANAMRISIRCLRYINDTFETAEACTTKPVQPNLDMFELPGLPNLKQTRSR